MHRLDGCRSRRELDLARRGDVDDRGRQAGGERVQQVLGRVGAGVGAEQDRRLARVDHERLAASGVFAAGGVEALDRRAVVGAVDPAVGGAELELGQLGLGLDQVERGEHLLRIHAVADRVCDYAHFATSSVLLVLWCTTRDPTGSPCDGTCDQPVARSVRSAGSSMASPSRRAEATPLGSPCRGKEGLGGAGDRG
jgi:hypothetical protein